MKRVKIKKIAVPYDGSVHSKHAFDMALNLAHKYKSKLILISCVEKLNGSVFGKDFAIHYQEDVKKHKDKIFRDITKLEAVAKKEKISLITKIFITDSTINQILSFTKYNKIDLIVMGSHGRTGFDKLILGSVANGIVQRSKIPVLVAR